MRKTYWLILLLSVFATVNLSVLGQKSSLPSNINDAFVVEFVAPFENLLIQTDEKRMPNRELSAVEVTQQTKIKNHKGKQVQPNAILPGMEIEIEIDKTNIALFRAKEIKIRTNPDKREEGVDGYLDRIEETRAMIDGRIVEFAPNTVLTGTKEWKGKTFTSFKEIPLGSLVDLKGVRQNNRVILVNRGEVRPNLFTPVETKLVETVKQGLVLPPPEKLGAGVEINGKSYKVCEDLAVNTYVNKVGNRIVPKFLRLLPPEDPNKVLFRFYVLEDETPNAAAFSDGSVFINTGLLKRLENEAQLAIILGHEIAHVTNEHSRRRFETQQNQAVWSALIGAGVGIVGGEQAALAVSRISYSLMSNKFSRDMEDQADRVGLYYAYDAGYDVRESPKLWRKLIGSYRETALGIALYVDHPAMLERLKESRREVVLNYANADFSEVVVGREKFVAGVGSYFGWIGEPPQLKKRVDNLPITKKQLITKTQSTKKTQPLKKTPVKTKTAIVKKIPKAAIRRINFRNFTYDSVDNGFENLQGGTTGSGKKTVFRLGKHIVKDDVKSLVGKISYADFNDDGVEEAFVIISSERPAAGTYWSADFYVFEYRAGKAVQIFHRGIYKVYGIELVGKKITTNAPFWRKDDAHCCPFATEDAVYEWQNGGFVRTSQNFKPLE